MPLHPQDDVQHPRCAGQALTIDSFCCDGSSAEAEKPPQVNHGIQGMLWAHTVAQTCP